MTEKQQQTDFEEQLFSLTSKLADGLENFRRAKGQIETAVQEIEDFRKSKGLPANFFNEMRKKYQFSKSLNGLQKIDIAIDFDDGLESKIQKEPGVLDELYEAIGRLGSQISAVRFEIFIHGPEKGKTTKEVKAAIQLH